MGLDGLFFEELNDRVRLLVETEEARLVKLREAVKGELERLYGVKKEAADMETDALNKKHREEMAELRADLKFKEHQRRDREAMIMRVACSSCRGWVCPVCGCGVSPVETHCNCTNDDK